MKYISDEDKMRVALDEARKALDIDEVPVGAAIFDKDDNLICANHNRRELDQNPMSHAEILVLEEASQILGTWRLEETTIAVTLEPDAMCAGAISLSRVKKLIYGAQNEKAGAAFSLYNIPQDPRLNHFVEIKDNILSHESKDILSSFFETKR
ncbi:nucleoside deaminase [Acidimicrobiaceae bacterium]|jgi:tRNA(adenine34) deaminase|nr:nucleoside deaminase [bacterium]MDA9727209.1 nucleoside deaminase [Acidimicrobiaceae bacterium]GIS38050.1 MAG: tRNA-specific adenosine deaminase [Actinomycetota bacterium]|tara:strand:- start:70 stop:528 length:459 start_codon:yes stop_codon:yes gene_type:complete